MPLFGAATGAPACPRSRTRAEKRATHGCRRHDRQTCAIRSGVAPEGVMAVILVIDDAATVRHLMRRVLVEAAHTVIEAQDGDIGLGLFQAQRPALVITDLFMPNREGIETI